MHPKAGTPTTTVEDLSQRLIDLEHVVLTQHGRISLLESRARETARLRPPRQPRPQAAALQRTQQKKAKDA